MFCRDLHWAIVDYMTGPGQSLGGQVLVKVERPTSSTTVAPPVVGGRVIHRGDGGERGVEWVIDRRSNVAWACFGRYLVAGATDVGRRAAAQKSRLQPSSGLRVRYRLPEGFSPPSRPGHGVRSAGRRLDEHRQGPVSRVFDRLPSIFFWGTYTGSAVHVACAAFEDRNAL